MSDLIIRECDPAQDAQQLADLFTESESSWPGGWTGGMPLTADRVLKWLESDRMVSTQVAVADGRVVGFCSFCKGTLWPSQQVNSGYLELLNVHPAYHGRSIGRKLVQATVERSVTEGWKYQTIATWSGNMKSVPTYKKTGYFWVPDSSVWLENYIPGALQMPLARPFFARHNWYQSYVRDLVQAPDDERWEGIKVYREQWRADGESLTIWIDREAKAPCAIETDEVMVSIVPRETEPLQGSAVQVNWRIQNKRAEPMHVHIQASGTKGLEIDHREAFTVPGGLTVEHAATVRVADDAPRTLDDGTAPKVLSVITLDHTEVELACGLQARVPLSIDTYPELLSIPAGAQRTVALQVHSELDAPVAGRCYLMPSPGLELDATELPLSLEARGHATLNLSLRPLEPGVHTISARLAMEPPVAPAPRQEITVWAVPAGGTLARLQDDTVRVETDAVRLTVAGHLGTLQLVHKDSGIALTRPRPLLGPPFFPGVFDHKDLALSLEDTPDGPVVILRGTPEDAGDLALELRVRLLPTGLMAVEQNLQNLAGDPWQGRLAVGCSLPEADGMRRTVPLQQGYVQALVPNFPVADWDSPEDPAGYTEPWIISERDGIAGGIAWGDGVARLEHDPYGVRLEGPQQQLARGERSATLRYACWIGQGDWRTAREQLLHWIGLPARDERPPCLETRPLAQVALPAPVLLTLEDHIATELTVDTVGARTLDAHLSVLAQDGLTAEPVEQAIPGLSNSQAVRVPLSLRVPGGIGRYRARTELTLPVFKGTSDWEVLRLGRPGTVSIQEEDRDGQRLWVVDNGLAPFVVAPQYGQSVISWRLAGIEQLRSSFPTPASLSWWYPWYGGIQLKAYLSREADDAGVLLGQPLEAEQVLTPIRGLTWSGVRLTVRPERKELRDLNFELEYLTLPHSPVMCARLRVINLRAAVQKVIVGGTGDVSLGGDPLTLEMLAEEVYQQPNPWSTWHQGRSWGALTQPASGASVLGVCPAGDLVLNHLGDQGRRLQVERELTLQPNATEQVLWYLVLADTLDGALAMRGLARA
ncbi:MAG: GNAT family N-acetyltransferase [Anaerolineae bacterium]|nr:GNAT family N-acetyltransferase [Chloroflexota bacterium]